MAHHEPIRRHVSDLRSEGKSPAPPPAEIPDKLYFRIGEAARLCEVPPYVLRFWEGEFPQLRPNKGGTGQRLFRRRDVEMARRIKCLLYDEGYTIPGARQLLRSDGKSGDPQLTLLAEDPAPSRHRNTQLRRLQQSLQDLLTFVSKKPHHPATSPPATPPKSALRVRPGSDNLFGVPAPLCSTDPQANDQTYDD